MRKQLVEKFVKNHPNHPLTKHFQKMIDQDIVTFNLVSSCIRLANKEQIMTPSEIQQADILEATMSLYRHDDAPKEEFIASN